MYRNLTDNEIDILVNRNCKCDDWSNIKVVDNFDPHYVRNSEFSGNIVLGSFENTVSFPGGIKKHSGIYNSALHDCTLGNNVYINNVREYIAGYVIEDNVVINNIGIMYVAGESKFGNDVRVQVLSEAGDRKVSIFNGLSSHIAYISTLYRHRSGVTDKITKMIEDYSSSVSSSVGRIGANALITACKSIINVNIGEYAEISGCDRLCNGTINSCKEDPSKVGYGVTAEDFIISSGTTVSGGAVIFKCFVGQGCELAKQYSAENSLFFANSAGFHGEACSIFAGPFTVTHHKSTLLISGMFSFMNAGSGSNQSNHMYKLGPIHQGIMERGAKTASDSYILWPAKIGVFTMVMGRHYKHSDTSDIPFSYLIEYDDKSYLVPGVNLRSIGTIRDAKKWPKRDKRKDPNKLDFVNYNLLSPFTVQKMMNGKRILKQLQDFSGKTTESYTYKNTVIRNSSLVKGIELYNTGIIKFLGNSVISRLENYDCKTDREIRERLKPSTETGQGDWVDIGGLIAPKDQISKILDDIDNGKIVTVDRLNDRFKVLHDNYYEYEWTWAFGKLHYLTSKPADLLTGSDIVEIIEKWKKAVIDLDNKLYDDAGKEFTLDSKVSFGTDGSEEEQNKDFENVRGDFERNAIVTEVLDHIRKKSDLAAFMINKMNGIVQAQQII